MAKRRKLGNAPRSMGKPSLKPPHKSSHSKQANDAKDKLPKKQHRQVHYEKPTIPFGPDDRILLIGEGDLSFAASIIKHHGCINVTATVLDKDHDELVAKYPSVDDNIAIINSEAPLRLPKTTPGTETPSIRADGTESTVEPAPEEDNSDDDYDETGARKPPRIPKNKLVYNVDATKLPNAITRQKPQFNRIFFNFPHVGGKSTDVNRQVRYNQSLLVSFFKSALPALAPGGTVVITLFEGEPYTLWNVKDLARHSDLQVDTSFKFQAAVYPGYKHARTLGVIKSKNGHEGGGWKGEQRPSRSYIFLRKGDAPSRQPAGKKKRKYDDDGSSSDDD